MNDFPPLPALPYKMYAPGDCVILMREYARAVRAQALEDAAKVCDRFAERGMHPAECAAAIRGMR